MVSQGEEDGYLVRDGNCSYAVYANWPEVGTLCGKVAGQVYREGYDAVKDNNYVELTDLTSENWDTVIETE